MSRVLCDGRINVKVKGRAYKTAVRRAKVYGVGTWPVKIIQERKVNVAEMQMFRRICGVIKRDVIKNKIIKTTTKGVEIWKEIQERSLKQFGHVRRRGDRNVGSRARSMEVQGTRRRGRPKVRWMDGIRKDRREETQLSEDDVHEYD